MKKHLHFVPSGSKIEIQALTNEGKAWLKTLRDSSRRVKPGTEGFVIRAFIDWLLSQSESSIKTALVGPSHNEKMKALQQQAAAAAKNNGELIAVASQLFQRRFRNSPVFILIDGDKTGPCTCRMQGNENSFPYYEGSGSNWKEARAAAASLFLEEDALR